MQFKPEILSTLLVSAFWLACGWRVLRLWLETRGSTNGTRALLVALGQLLGIRGAELAYVAIVWTIPIARRMGNEDLEHAIKAGYLLLNMAGILALWRLVTVWQGKRS